jgi:hexosaminidase
MQSCNADVFAPAEIIISVSDDGVNFKQIDKKTFVVDRLPDFFIKNYEWKGTARGRYIRYQAHSDAKFGCWLFTDEIVVNPQ